MTFVITIRDIIGIAFMLLFLLIFGVIKGLEWWESRKRKRKREAEHKGLGDQL